MLRFAGLLIVLAATLGAQQPVPAATPSAPGSVTGRVFCEDTGQPGRFATVQLVSDHPAANPIMEFNGAALGKNPDFEKTLAKALTSVMKGNNLSTVTGIDGAFSLEKVPPGTYYVLAQLAGYQSPLRQFSQMELMKTDAAALEAVESSSPKIVVQSGQPVHADIQLERGASISGTIHYGDGSPAPAVTPILMVQGKDAKWKELSSANGILPVSTDDRGHFRIYGVAAGKYAVKAALPTMQAMTGLGASISMHMNMGDALIVYSGGAMREKDLKPVEVGPGAEVDGVDVIFPLDNLHMVAGNVVAKSDGHAVDTGTIVLEDPDTKAMLRTMTVNPDGTFRLNYVPEGQYQLAIRRAGDTDSDDPGGIIQSLNPTFLKKYQDATVPIEVKTDQTGLVVQLNEQAAAETPAKPPTP